MNGFIVCGHLVLEPTIPICRCHAPTESQPYLQEKANRLPSVNVLGRRRTWPHSITLTFSTVANAGAHPVDSRTRTISAKGRTQRACWDAIVFVRPKFGIHSSDLLQLCRGSCWNHRCWAQDENACTGLLSPRLYCTANNLSSRWGSFWIYTWWASRTYI